MARIVRHPGRNSWPATQPAPMRARLTRWICGITSILFLLVIAITHRYATEQTIKSVRDQAQTVADLQGERMDAQFRSAAGIPIVLAMDMAAHEDADLQPTMQRILEGLPPIRGACVAFESPTRSLSVYRQGATIASGALTYDYFQSDWYRAATSVPVWTEPYFDPERNDTVLVTCAVPFFHNGIRRGVAKVDVSLSDLTAQLAEQRLHGGYAFLISGDDTVITFPSPSLVLKSLRQVDKVLADAVNPDAPAALTGPDPWHHEASWIYSRPIPSTGYSVVTVVPVAAVMAPLYESQAWQLTVAAVGLLLMMAMIAWIAGSLSRPLSLLARSATRVAEGHFDEAIPVTETADEVQVLARDFNHMLRELQRQIEARETAIAAREKLQSELRVASDIQRAILPRAYPGGCEGFDVAAVMAPAEEVAGDLYDYFPLGPDRVAVMVGDVSGKGVAAAIFMAVAATFLKAVAQGDKAPGACLEEVNAWLCRGNEEMLFVTMFYGVLDVRSGRLTYANAGHNSPYRVRGGQAAPLPCAEDVALGIRPHARYVEQTIQLLAGDALVLYSDGITEAFNARQEAFGERRLEAELRGGASVDRVLAAVREHARDVPQSDDITLVVLRYDGLVLRMPLDLEALPALLARVPTDMQLALEEVVTNILRHSAPSSEIVVRLAGRTLVVEDDGPPFNPLEHPAPDIDAPLDARSPGGLGIHMVRNLVDEVRYRREGNRNVLELIKRDPPEGGQ